MTMANKRTKFENMSKVVEILANDFTEQERAALLKMDFTPLKGLSGEQLKSRLSKINIAYLQAFFTGR